MASPEKGIVENNRHEDISVAGTMTCDFTDIKASLKKEKARAKSNLTRLKSKVLFLIKQQDLPSRREIQDACTRMDSSMESAINVMTNLSEF